MATRNIALGIAWTVSLRAELALRAGVSDVIADTGLGEGSLAVGASIVLPPLVLGGSSVDRSLERLDDSLFALTATGGAQHGSSGPIGFRSAMILLRPCDSVPQGQGLAGGLCTLHEGAAIHLFP
ncbi:MAG: hypothetical protein E4G90_01840 [Gemmatimonadales bacterium]|nr:MAG: hypothetical protein E4G90_01840 [Gemmatimonadales bacterium]